LYSCSTIALFAGVVDGVGDGVIDDDNDDDDDEGSTTGLRPCLGFGNFSKLSKMEESCWSSTRSRYREGVLRVFLQV